MSSAEDLPVARVAADERRSFVWVLPVAAGLAALLLGWRAWVARGPSVVVEASEGHGIRAGDPLRFRGITVGEVERVRLARDLAEVVLDVRLDPAASGLARAGSRFWIVRPMLSVGGARGLETLLGARYVAVLPGPAGAEPQERFVALDEPPVPEILAPGGLEITLSAPSRGGLAPGAPLIYREVRVGSVLSVGLASDATSIEVRAYVRPAYARLVREDTRFWRSGGLAVQLGVRGLNVEVGSLSSLLVGGIALATPESAGAQVRTGHRFELAAEPDDHWLEWQPALPVGSSLLPEASLPPLLRAQKSWTKGRLIGRSQARQGWLVPLEGGLFGPRDLLVPDDGAREGTSELDVAGRSLALTERPGWSAHGLARIDAELDPSIPRWPAERRRAATAPEDCLVVSDAASPPMALAAVRLEPRASTWAVDGAIAFPDGWHGAAVVAREDGRLIGILLLDGERARVAPLPADLEPD